MSRVTLAALLLGAQLAVPAHAATPTTKGAAATAEPMVVVLDTARGNIVIELAEKDAPKTCANFRKLVRQGDYDGTTFHRVIAGFMIQGGDPNSKDTNPFDDGEGGPAYTVPAEIKLPHVRGAVAMARLPDQVNPKRASSSCQFFIDVADRKDLDRGGYTVFGRVIQGMDVVDAIVALKDHKDTVKSSMGANPGKMALIRRATWEPRAKYLGPPSGARVQPPATPATADTAR